METKEEEKPAGNSPAEKSAEFPTPEPEAAAEERAAESPEPAPGPPPVSAPDETSLEPAAPLPEPEGVGPKAQEEPTVTPPAEPAESKPAEISEPLPPEATTQNLDDLRARANAARTQRRAENLERIIVLAGEKGNITNDDVRDHLRVSQSTATAYLGELTRSGRLRRAGTAKWTKYTT